MMDDRFQYFREALHKRIDRAAEQALADILAWSRAATLHRVRSNAQQLRRQRERASPPTVHDRPA